MKEVNDEKAFWFCNNQGFVGMIAHNLTEFSDCLKKAPVESLEFHFREDKDDFGTWLTDVMEEPKLAASTKRIKKNAQDGKKLKASVERFAKRINKST